jgi:MFS family permease
MNMSDDAELRTVSTSIPARLDRLPWARWHWMILLGLGTVWILDGLEVTIVGAIGSRLTEQGSGIELTESQVGAAASFYVIGACLGAVTFGYLTDRFGRKLLFLVTLALYLAATVATAFAPNPVWFWICRFFTGAGIGGEYAAVNSAIDELIPARLRGTVNLVVNGSFWLGTAVGAALSIPLLDTSLLPQDIGWRVLFGLGALLGIGILFIRRMVPESPRWLFIHGRDRAADDVVAGIEREVGEQTGTTLDEPRESIRIRQRRSVGVGLIVHAMIRIYPRRSVLGLALFVGQAFLYNAVFFTYALVLDTFFQVPANRVGWYLIPIGLGNFFGPFLLSRLFDSVGRRAMISTSYIGSGALLVVTALLFQSDVLTATTLTACWVAVFFLASAGASAAYLTVSEIFPLEIRAMAIAVFYALGTGLGGVIGPLLFGRLIESGSATQVMYGYLLGAGLMMAAGVVELLIGVEAARRSLEQVARPLSAADVPAAAR